MSFCTFSKENSKSGKTILDNQFIQNYLPDAPDQAVKVYLYGLYLCQNSEFSLDLPAFSEVLNLEQSEVIDCFKYWDEYGVLSIVSETPFAVHYYPLNESTSKYRRFNPEKYEEFSKSVQSIITGRMISVTEYNEYFNLMENTSLKPDALLIIIKYCAGLKGDNIGYKYILSVTKDFISRGITTVELINDELNGYFVSSGELSEVLKALKTTKMPEIEDMQLYKHWTEKLDYEHSFILEIIKTTKCKTIKKLDKTIEELYSNKIFTIEDAKSYFATKKELFDLCLEISKKLGLYIEVLDNVLATYVSPWRAMGFDGNTLLFIADYCFRKNKRTFELMNETVLKLYKLGLITVQSITLYIERHNKNDEFIEKFLSYAGASRKPNAWDRENLENWRNWNFTDDMILEAAKRSAHTANPIAYMNSVLSNWKSANIFTVKEIESQPVQTKQSPSKTVHFENERKYTQSNLDDLLKRFEDFKV
ncbi:MAG: DnaD domain protein [Clostridia bacterium]|nr:DnaD domain protein [Clostridia bacterium]